MPDPTTTSAPVVVDEAYKSAIQPVIDNTMRTDILGPHFVNVLENHTPASEKVKAVIAEAIANHPACKLAIEEAINNFDTKRKSRWMDKLIGAGWAILIAVITSLVIYFVRKGN